MLIERNPGNDFELYSYFLATHKDVPYCFPIAYDRWHESMFHDRDDDQKPLFAVLKTFALLQGQSINGFIQFGLSSFALNGKGEKDYSRHYAVIRNLHYQKNANNARLLLDQAAEYFESKGEKESYAFFHYFGMRCYAGQGKLHASGFHMEELLNRYGYRLEHENIYYSRPLRLADLDPPSSGVSFVYGGDRQTIVFMRDAEAIGGCELSIVPQTRICFLKWIYIDEKYSHQGLGTICMNKLFYELKQEGITRLDTDTASGNTNAQGYYIKTGFIDKGKMRSYQTI